MKKANEKGFTLAELLIVVAIIGVLVAVAIPSFTSYLEKARESTDLSNLRSAYSAASVYILEHQDSTVKTLYFDPSATGNIVTSGGAKIGRKASVENQQSNDSNLTFSTRYTYGPISFTSGGNTVVNNAANNESVIEITLDANGEVAMVSFKDDKIISSIEQKTVADTKAYKLTDTFAQSDLAKIEIKVTKLDGTTEDVKYETTAANGDDPAVYNSDFTFYAGADGATSVATLTKLDTGKTITSGVTDTDVLYVFYKGEITKIGGITFDDT